MELLTEEEIKRQTRELWKTCFHDSEDFLGLYFEDKYTSQNNFTLREQGRVVAACQMLPYRFTFYGNVLHSAYLSGLCTVPALRNRGLASRLVSNAHRRLYEQGAALSFLVPGDEALRHFYESERHGAYWTAAYRQEIRLEPAVAPDSATSVHASEEWGRELYVCYRRQTQKTAFMLHPGENDFFAALEDCANTGGKVLEARRRGSVCGLMLVAREKDGRCFAQELAAKDDSVTAALVAAAKEQLGASDIYFRAPCNGNAPAATPYAMARIINVRKFLSAIFAAYPGFELHVGVGNDFDIPENNGYYRLASGRVETTEERPDTVLTPGGLAALFLGAVPVRMPMLLDE